MRSTLRIMCDLSLGQKYYLNCLVLCLDIVLLCGCVHVQKKLRMVCSIQFNKNMIDNSLTFSCILCSMHQILQAEATLQNCARFRLAILGLVVASIGIGGTVDSNGARLRFRRQIFVLVSSSSSSQFDRA